MASKNSFLIFRVRDASRFNLLRWSDVLKNERRYDRWREQLSDCTMSHPSYVSSHGNSSSEYAKSRKMMT